MYTYLRSGAGKPGNEAVDVGYLLRLSCDHIPQLTRSQGPPMQSLATSDGKLDKGKLKGLVLQSMGSWAGP